MRRDVHLAALKVATRLTTGVAFSVALMGCSSADPSSDDGQEASTADDLSNALKTSKKKKQGCHEPDAAPPPALSCKEVLDAAFPTPSNYPGTKTTTVTADVEACCDQELTGTSLGGDHRWDCCANISQKDDKIGMACTPWGPPVPPKMKRRMLALTMGVA
jgi:hypothetical protein